MGNLVSLDMGLVILRCTIFDKHDKLKEILEQCQNEETEITEKKKSKDLARESRGEKEKEFQLNSLKKRSNTTKIKLEGIIPTGKELEDVNKTEEENICVDKDQIEPKKQEEESKEEVIQNEVQKPTELNGFDFNLSFYSANHEGKFYFLQYNILETEKFFKSKEFKAVVIFLSKELFDMVNSPNVKYFNKMFKVSPRKEEFKYMKYSGINLPQSTLIETLTDLSKKMSTIKGKNLTVFSTGGYNDLYLNFLQSTFQIQILKSHHYFNYVVKAIDFLSVSDENCFFEFNIPENSQASSLGYVGRFPTHNMYTRQRLHFGLNKELLYPYILVSIRSGATFLKVSSPTDCQRIGSSVIGASTYWGLTRLLTNYRDPTEAMNAAITDMSVGDIYGKAYSALGLQEDLIASSFAKVRNTSDEDIKKIEDRDISKSLLTMLAVNTIQIANMMASLEQINTMILVGSNSDIVEFMQMAAHSLDFWSDHKRKLIFPKHSTFLGSLGVYLQKVAGIRLRTVTL